MLEKVRSIIRFQEPAFQLALKYHVRVAFGLGNSPALLPREFGALVRGGMQPIDAIRAATINAAELLGWQSSVGFIESGKYADIIAVAGDPLADIGEMGRVKFVMKGGKVYKDRFH